MLPPPPPPLSGPLRARFSSVSLEAVKAPIVRWVRASVAVMRGENATRAGPAL